MKGKLRINVQPCSVCHQLICAKKEMVFKERHQRCQRTTAVDTSIVGYCKK